MRSLVPGALAACLALVLASPPARADDAPGAEATDSHVAGNLPGRVDAIRIRISGGFGIDHTREVVVRRELGFREGDVVSREAFELATTNLWNTNLFAHVHTDVVREGDKVVAVFDLEDRVSLNPLFGYGVGGNAYYVRGGVSDTNFLGRFLEIDAQYEYFQGFSGGQVIFHDPRLFGERLDLLVQLERLARPRPGFSDLRTQGIVELLRLAYSDRLRTGLRVSVIDDRMLSPLDPPAFYPNPTTTLALEPSLRIGRVDTVRIRQRGASLEVRPSVGFTTSNVASGYEAMTLDALAFAMFGSRWNVAARVHGATSSRVPEQLEYYAGGLDFVRGFPDNYVRSTALVLANVEMRFVAFDSTWIALMPVVFADAVAERSPWDGLARGAFAVGFGARVLVPKFVNTGFRFDFGVPLASNVEAGAPPQPASPTAPLRTPPVVHAPLDRLEYSLGVYQFF